MMIFAHEKEGALIIAVIRNDYDPVESFDTYRRDDYIHKGVV